MTDDVKVRIATPDEVHQCMDLALLCCSENGVARPNKLKLLDDIWPALNRYDGIVGVIGKKGGMLEGIVLLRIGCLWYSDVPIIEEKAVFVHPKYRSAKGGRARKLCEFSKQVAVGLGYPLVIGVLSTKQTKAKVRMYDRVFGPAAGAYYLWGTGSGQWVNTPF
jgi:hypothetical protein